ncbi:ParB/RepB/Spo0J family partition protein [Geomonas sp. Red32]|uniref:ParB/RepB/Spo0J family partition protein n=1 Tax=Geomonas sp. Red32 TaxID=2912856 RepID=UPI00202CDADC|nr:ParB/RepB/Spo0J family partition protein [Geomonas sp. Red32]MCM0080912.1 ParB/RepB/Spo0J family partition protein [Geomonas sp. Red32]
MVQGVKKYQKGKLYQVSPAELSPDPDQPRKYFDPTALEELTESLLKQGVLQPILARKVPPEGKLVVVSGERRYQAAVKGGLSTVPVIVTDGEPLEVSIVENLLRENLTAIEEAEAIERLKSRNDYQITDLAAMLGKSQASLCEILSLTKLPASVKEDCRNEPKTPRYVLVQIAKQPSSKKMEKLYQKYKERGLTVGALRSSERGKLAPGATAVDIAFITAFLKKLDGLDVARLDPQQVAQLTEHLGRLQSAALAKLGAVSSLPAGGTISS